MADEAAVRTRLIAALGGQRLVAGDAALATAFADCGTVHALAAGETLVTQGGGGSDLFLVLSGRFAVLVNNTRVADIPAGEHVGEMAMIDPAMPRTATVRADAPATVLRVPAAQFVRLADQRGELWRRLAFALAQRLENRNFAAGADG